MSFKPSQDKHSKRTSFTIDNFAGAHYGVDATDQSRQYAFVSDFDFLGNVMSMRAGCIKNVPTGEASTIESLFNIKIGKSNWIGIVHNGILDLQSVNTGTYEELPITWNQEAQKYNWNDDGNWSDKT